MESIYSLPEEHADGVYQLLSSMESLQHDKDTSDIVFLVSPKEIPVYAHRLIIWNRCMGFHPYRREFWTAPSSPDGRVPSGPDNRGQSPPLCIKYPQFDVDSFRQIITYIYTGKLSLHETVSFRVLSISRELGLECLTRRCTDFITNSLSIHNSCAFYAASLQLDEEKGGTSTDGVIVSNLTEQCQEYLEQNASQCVQTEGWLELPKHTLTTLLASQNFALEEEDIWRSVLCWAKYHAGVPFEKPTHQWSDHDKTLVCQALSGVIQHVKLLLIDSKVFAEEVEPTGAVPIELSLERYRYAALPNQQTSTEDDRLRPRINTHLFPNSTILCGSKQHYQKTLNQWFGTISQRWTLVYKASQHGYSAADFHKHCDGHSPTFVIVQGHTGNVCGGFSDVPWTSKAPSRGRFISSKNSFLFTLINKQGIPATKFPVTKPECATVQHPSYGPVFGAGADLSIASHCHGGMECYSNLGHSYGGQSPAGPPHKHAKCSTLMGDYNFNVKDYEVYTIINVDSDL